MSAVITELAELLAHNRVSCRTFPGTRHAVADVRAFVKDRTTHHGFPTHVAHNAALAASELATNAINYTRSAGGEFIVWVASEHDTIHVAVVDGGPLPDPPVDLDRPGGWGLLIVARITTAHGAFTGNGTHTAWFKIRIPEGGL